jgi:hypothetical protein
MNRPPPSTNQLLLRPRQNSSLQLSSWEIPSFEEDVDIKMSALSLIEDTINAVENPKDESRMRDETIKLL